MTLRVFPVDGSYHFADDFGPGHRGTDIFAPAGSLVRAVDDGRVRAGQESLGGNVVYLTAPDATYFYGHLQEYVGAYPRAVRAGDIIGRVGTSGNAENTSPHVHFEVHAFGETLNPYPELVRVSSQSERSSYVPLLVGAAIIGGIWWYFS
jgi:murein DD-endopeptidase MepM/ murein hydrolase activator NlpD